MDGLVKIGEISGDEHEDGRRLSQILEDNGYTIVLAQGDDYSTYLYYICKKRNK